jgi:hypothetical protein
MAKKLEPGRQIIPDSLGWNVTINDTSASSNAIPNSY